MKRDCCGWRGGGGNEQGCALLLECALYLPDHQSHLFQYNSIYLIPYSWSSQNAAIGEWQGNFSGHKPL